MMFYLFDDFSFILAPRFSRTTLMPRAASAMPARQRDALPPDAPPCERHVYAVRGSYFFAESADYEKQMRADADAFDAPPIELRRRYAATRRRRAPACRRCQPPALSAIYASAAAIDARFCFV